MHKLELPVYVPGNAVFYYDLFFALTESYVFNMGGGVERRWAF